MKVTLALQIRNVEKHLRISIYEQDNGKFYAIRVWTNVSAERGMSIHSDITRDEAIGLAEL